MLSIGIDLGGTKCLGAVVDDAGTVVHERRVPTPAGAEAIVETVHALARDLRERAASPVAGVGVGAPGLVDRGGVLRFAPNLPGVTDLPLAGPLAARLATKVVVENDASAAAWGEWRAGAARGRADVVVVTLGTGIGGGIVLGGELYRGASGFAGEIGHMVVDPGGPECPCGRRGCWERVASGGGLTRLGREAAKAGRAARVVALAGGDPAAVHGEHVTRAAAEGDAEALDIIQTLARWLALGLANLADVFDPECIVVGGGLAEAGDLLLDPVRAEFAGQVEAGDHRPPIDIVAAALGERAGAIGAALLVERR